MEIHHRASSSKPSVSPFLMLGLSCLKDMSIIKNLDHGFPDKFSLPLPGRFRIQRQKESTGRVVFWNMGITCSYTLEASYGGTNMGSRAFTHFNTDDYEGVGR